MTKKKRGRPPKIGIPITTTEHTAATPRCPKCYEIVEKPTTINTVPFAENTEVVFRRCICKCGNVFITKFTRNPEM